MKLLSAAISLGALAAADKPHDYYHAKWDKFKVDYNKNFPSNGDEEQKRFNIFKTNVDIIDAHNAKHLSYTFGINEFSDLTSEEFFHEKHVLPEGFFNKKPAFGNLPKLPFPNITDVADSIDWVAKGAVTPVKNQAHCGSCWAFSTTGSVEGAYFVASGKLESLSEEDLVECDHNGDHGCRGGLMDHAFDWISENGICSESAYPYTSGGGQSGTCKTPKCSPAVTLTGKTDVPANDENALKAAVSKQPVSVAIEADKYAFQHYAGGVLDNPACGTQLDHGVLVVGYGTDGGKDYWKVKNSWGAAWGDQGYIRMVRNKNQCGISQAASYPTGAKAAAPSPPSPPSPPTPPSPPSNTHYEDPKGGCRSDEKEVQLYGIQGSYCAPSCGFFTSCPTDVPTGVTASPQCGYYTIPQYCALICNPSASDDQCGTNASCKTYETNIHVCTYDDAGRTSTAAKEHAVYDGRTEGIVV